MGGVGEPQFPIGVSGDAPAAGVDLLVVVVTLPHQVRPGCVSTVGVEGDVVDLIDAGSRAGESAVVVSGEDRGP